VESDKHFSSTIKTITDVLIMNVEVIWNFLPSEKQKKEISDLIEEQGFNFPSLIESLKS